MSESKDTEIRSKYDDLTVEELTEELKTSFFCSSQISGKDVTEMEQMIDVLQQKSPLPDVYSGKELWERFLEVHGEEVSSLGIRNTEEVEEKESEVASATVVPVAVPVKATVEPSPAPKRGFRKLLHTALIAAAVVAAMVIITVSASAVGINIWGWVPVWNDSTFKFMPEEAVSEDIPKVLKQLGIEKPLFPTWLPDGFVIDEQQIQSEKPIFILSSYLNKNQTITITIRESTDRINIGTAEKNAGDPEVYPVGDISHYIFTNYNQTIATWRVDELLIRITGDITSEEMVRIINSIYEVTE